MGARPAAPAGGAYKMILAKPGKAEPKPKVEGEIYVLPKEFLVNLADGRFAKLQVALVGEPAAGGGGHGAPAPPEGYGSEPQEAIVRDLITDTLTDVADHELIRREGREQIKKKILVAIKKHPDVHVEEALFPDVTVQ
jgi:flagellar basal body-associated protein FliL